GQGLADCIQMLTNTCLRLSVQSSSMESKGSSSKAILPSARSLSCSDEFVTKTGNQRPSCGSDLGKSRLICSALFSTLLRAPSLMKTEFPQRSCLAWL